MGDVMRITSSLFSQCHLVLTKEKYCVLYASARFLQDSCQNGPPYLAPLNEDLADILGTMLWQCDNCNSIFWVLRWMRLSYLRSQLRIVFIFVFSVESSKGTPGILCPRSAVVSLFFHLFSLSISYFFSYLPLTYI